MELVGKISNYINMIDIWIDVCEKKKDLISNKIYMLKKNVMKFKSIECLLVYIKY